MVSSLDIGEQILYWIDILMTVLILIDKFVKEIKCKVCLEFYIFFFNKLNIFSITGAGKLDSVYHKYDIRSFSKFHFGSENITILSL